MARPGFTELAPSTLHTPGYLHPGLGQPQPLAQLLPHEGVRVVGLVEKPFQLVQLLQGEICSAPPLFDFRLPFVFHPFRILLAVLQLWGDWARHRQSDRRDGDRGAGGAARGGGSGEEAARTAELIPRPAAPLRRGNRAGAPRSWGSRERGLCARGRARPGSAAAVPGPAARLR